MLIGELSRLTGVSAHLLRYYEKQGLLVPARGTNGYRHYDDGAVTTVRQIRSLLAAGLATEDIAALLPCATGTAPELEPCTELLDTLRARLAQIDARVATLWSSRMELRRYLTTTEAAADGVETASCADAR